jgi:hypothetical protein
LLFNSNTQKGSRVSKGFLKKRIKKICISKKHLENNAILAPLINQSQRMDLPFYHQVSSTMIEKIFGETDFP